MVERNKTEDGLFFVRRLLVALFWPMHPSPAQSILIMGIAVLELETSGGR